MITREQAESKILRMRQYDNIELTTADDTGENDRCFVEVAALDEPDGKYSIFAFRHNHPAQDTDWQLGNMADVLDFFDSWIESFKIEADV